MSEQQRGFEKAPASEDRRSSALSDLVMFSDGLKTRLGDEESVRAARELARTLETEMIPRLMLAYRMSPDDVALTPETLPQENMIVKDDR